MEEESGGKAFLCMNILPMKSCEKCGRIKAPCSFSYKRDRKKTMVLKKLTLQEALNSAETLLANWRNREELCNIRSYWLVELLRKPTMDGHCILVVYERIWGSAEFVVGNIFEVEPSPIPIASLLQRHVNACYKEWLDSLKTE